MPRAAKSGRTPSQATSRATASDRATPSTPRSEIKNAEARAKLMPLEEGERPRAVTVAAFVPAALALFEIVAAITGQKIRGSQTPTAGIVLFTIVMLAAAWGAWRVRYWAVLGIQALLALIILLFSLFLIRASTWTDALLCLVAVGAAGTLFYFLVKSLARIQMPDRRPR